MKLPTELEFYDTDGKPFLVRYDYNRGEAQWFDARAGVGSPGYDPFVEVTEINLGNGWITPDQAPQFNMSILEADIMERLADLERDEEAARAEAEYEAWQDAKRYGGEE